MKLPKNKSKNSEDLGLSKDSRMAQSVEQVREQDQKIINSLIERNELLAKYNSSLLRKIKELKDIVGEISANTVRKSEQGSHEGKEEEVAQDSAQYSDAELTETNHSDKHLDKLASVSDAETEQAIREQIDLSNELIIKMNQQIAHLKKNVEFKQKDIEKIYRHFEVLSASHESKKKLLLRVKKALEDKTLAANNMVRIIKTLENKNSLLTKELNRLNKIVGEKDNVINKKDRYYNAILRLNLEREQKRVSELQNEIVDLKSAKNPDKK